MLGWWLGRRLGTIDGYALGYSDGNSLGKVDGDQDSEGCNILVGLVLAGAEESFVKLGSWEGCTLGTSVRSSFTAKTSLTKSNDLMSSSIAFRMSKSSPAIALRGAALDDASSIVA